MFRFYSFTFESEAVIKQVIEQYHLDFNIYHLSREICNKLNNNSGFPNNILVNKNGIIEVFKSGGSNEASFVRAFFEDIFYGKIDSLLKK